MKRKFKFLLLLFSLSLTLGMMSNTYSRYIADTTGEMKVVFAKWQILVNDTDITNSKSSSINLVPIMEENPNITDGTVAPSSKGYFDINIDPTNVNVSFNYSISLNVVNQDIPDLMITKYAILDKNYQEGDNIEYNTLSTDNMITGTLEHNNNKTFEPFTVRVYFEWYDDTDNTMNDESDTEIGNKAALEDTELKINAKINFKQKLK